MKSCWTVHPIAARLLWKTNPKIAIFGKWISIPYPMKTAAVLAGNGCPNRCLNMRYMDAYDWQVGLKRTYWLKLCPKGKKQMEFTSFYDQIVKIHVIIAPVVLINIKNI